MSLLARPSVVFAIVFGCFAILIPRVFLPMFRSKPASTNNYDERFRRPSPALHRGDSDDNMDRIQGTPPHMHGPHPGMRMHHPGVNGHPNPSSERTGSKSIVALALPMYSVGIGAFFIYTCCKYWTKKDPDENKRKNRFLNGSVRWNKEKRKPQYDILDKNSEDEGNKEDFYGGLDPDYVEYLKTKKQKALDAERAMTDEQRQMHHALEEMKKSLSFISSKLVTKESRDSLNNAEITQLQERLATTELQMCKILSALDAATEKVNTTAKPDIGDERIPSSKSCSEDESAPDQDWSDDDEQVPNDEAEEPDQEFDEDDQTE